MKAIINEEKIKPELIFDKNGLRVFRYKKLHYIYTNQDKHIEDTTIQRRDRKSYETRVFKCDYIYRLVMSRDLINRVNEITKKEPINKYQEKGIYDNWYDGKFRIRNFAFNTIRRITGYDLSKLIFVSYDTISYRNATVRIDGGSREFYDTSKFVELFDFTDTEKEAQTRESKDKFMNTYFYNPIHNIAVKHKLTTAKFDNGKTYFRAYVGDDISTSIYNFAHKLIEDTLMKELDELGFIGEIDEDDLKNTICHSKFVKNIRLKDDIVKENKDENSN